MTTTTRQEKRQPEPTRKPQRRRGGKGPLSNQLVVGGLAIVAFIGLLLGLRAAGVLEAPPPPLDVSTVDTGATIGTKIPDLGNEHIPTGQKSTYNSVPPTSGQHWAAPAAPAPWGIKDTTLPNEVTTHNLEHGGVVIVYNGLSAADTDQLKSIVRGLMSGQYRKIVLEPYLDMKDAKVAITAWDWILKLQGPDQNSLVRFLKQHYDGPDAPESGIPP